MSQLGNEFVPAAVARAIRRKAGANILIANQSAVDVYYSFNVSDLNNTAPGIVPGGTKLAAGTSATVLSWPELGLWVRAISDTVIEVQP